MPEGNAYRRVFLCSKGHEIGPDDNFCSECSERLTNLSTSSSTTPQPATTKPSIISPAELRTILCVATFFLTLGLQPTYQYSDTLLVGMWVVAFPLILGKKITAKFLKVILYVVVIIGAIALFIYGLSSVPPLAWTIALGIVIGSALVS